MKISPSTQSALLETAMQDVCPEEMEKPTMSTFPQLIWQQHDSPIPGDCVASTLCGTYSVVRGADENTGAPMLEIHLQGRERPVATIGDYTLDYVIRYIECNRDSLESDSLESGAPEGAVQGRCPDEMGCAQCGAIWAPEITECGDCPDCMVQDDLFVPNWSAEDEARYQAERAAEVEATLAAQVSRENMTPEEHTADEAAQESERRRGCGGKTTTTDCTLNHQRPALKNRGAVFYPVALLKRIAQNTLLQFLWPNPIPKPKLKPAAVVCAPVQAPTRLAAARFTRCAKRPTMARVSL